jgi:ABC-type bacteriocin/lantibiotic exporter with double-glycine peptidase domain
MADQTNFPDFLKQLLQPLRTAIVLVALVAIVYVFLMQFVDHGLGWVPYLIILLVVFITIQFFRLEKNKSEGSTENHITKGYTIPAEVQGIITTSCYDCHSNNTKYPWYAKICPIDWWLNSYIIMRKIQVNFSEFVRGVSELIILEFVNRNLSVNANS